MSLFQEEAAHKVTQLHSKFLFIIKANPQFLSWSYPFILLYLSADP